MTELLSSGGHRAPTTSYIWGSVRPVVNAFAVAWAHELSSDPFWIEVSSPSGPPQPDPAAAAQFPPDRLLVVGVPSRLAPADPISSPILGSLVRTEEDREAVGQLAEFLRLPRPVRDAANQGRVGAGPGAIVVANCDRLRPYYPGFANQNRELIGSLRHAGVSIVYTLTGEPAPDRRGGPFDAVIEVEAESLRAWRRGRAIPEKVPDGALLSTGRPRALSSIPGVARLLASVPATG